MKKFFTLAALSLLGASMAFANHTHSDVAQEPQRLPSYGCEEHAVTAMYTNMYSTSTMKNEMGVISMYDGQIMKVCFMPDGSVYFHNPFCLGSNSFPEKQKLIGTIDENGLITIPMHQVVYSFNDDEKSS